MSYISTIIKRVIGLLSFVNLFVVGPDGTRTCTLNLKYLYFIDKLQVVNLIFKTKKKRNNKKSVLFLVFSF